MGLRPMRGTPAHVQSATQRDQIWREQSRAKAAEESTDGGGTERGAAATVSIARGANGAAAATAQATTALE
jgi:hypothetical protein